MTDAVPNLGDVCTFLGIGTPRGEPKPVTGGLLHRMWRIETESGIFAMKVLNPEIMSRPTAAQNFRISERIARAVKNHGVCAVVARTVGDDPWIKTNGSYVMVFDWEDGRTLSPEECTTEAAARIGQILFQIHHLDIEIEGLMPTIWSGISEDIWKSHIEKARHSTFCWGFPSETLLLDVLNWSRVYQDTADQLSKRMVISHRDLDPKNVIWGDQQTPYVIDWESAGYVNPTVELIEAAINWSRNQDGACDKIRFQALIESYARAGGTIHGQVTDALYGSMGGMLGWLEYNMRRSVDEDVFGSDERHLAQREVKQTVQQLRELIGSIIDFAQWCEEISG